MQGLSNVERVLCGCAKVRGVERVWLLGEGGGVLVGERLAKLAGLVCQVQESERMRGLVSSSRAREHQWSWQPSVTGHWTHLIGACELDRQANEHVLIFNTNHM